jgi:hypothetical protein
LVTKIPLPYDIALGFTMKKLFLSLYISSCNSC